MAETEAAGAAGEETEAGGWEVGAGQEGTGAAGSGEVEGCKDGTGQQNRIPQNQIQLSCA